MTGSETQNHAPSQPDPRLVRIAALNDRIRKTNEGGITFLSRDVALMAGAKTVDLLKQVADYDRFTKANDPQGERNRGAVLLFGKEVLWEIGYYDEQAVGPSKDPANADVTTRIMTIMLASEY